MNEFRFVFVTWDDAWGDAHENISPADVSEKHAPTRMQTSGWLLKDDDRGVSLFAERCLDQGDGGYRGRTFIPRAMIISVSDKPNPRKPRKPKAPPPEENQ